MFPSPAPNERRAKDHQTLQACDVPEPGKNQRRFPAPGIFAVSVADLSYCVSFVAQGLCGSISVPAPEISETLLFKQDAVNPLVGADLISERQLALLREWNAVVCDFTDVLNITATSLQQKVACHRPVSPAASATRHTDLALSQKQAAQLQCPGL